MPSFANQAVLSSLFGRQANVFGDAINAAIRGHQKEALQHDAGHRFVVMAFRDSIRVSDPVLNLEGSSRVCIHYIDGNADNCDALQSQIRCVSIFRQKFYGIKARRCSGYTIFVFN